MRYSGKSLSSPLQTYPKETMWCSWSKVTKGKEMLGALVSSNKL